MSNLTTRGTIKGVIRSGGGGGVTDYDQLTGRPQINSNLLTGDKGGHDLGLMNLNDIRITKIVDLTYGTNYDLEFPDDHVYITNQVFQPASAGSNGTKGLVPRPSAGDNGKILSNEGWISLPTHSKIVDTLWEDSTTPPTAGTVLALPHNISDYDSLVFTMGTTASTYKGILTFAVDAMVIGQTYIASSIFLQGTVSVSAYFEYNADNSITIRTFSPSTPSIYYKIQGIKY